MVANPLSIVVVSFALVVSACGASSGGSLASGDESWLAGVELDSPVRKPDAVLIDTNGDPYDLRAQTDGVVTLLYFGYTKCPDICPVNLAQVQQVLEDPDMPSDVEFVFVSVDPERDTAPVIRAWLDKFDKDFVGLTGTPDEITKIQQDAGVMVAYPNPEDGGRTVAHAAQVIAYAPNGYAYSVYPFGTRPAQWLNDLPIIDQITAAP